MNQGAWVYAFFALVVYFYTVESIEYSYGPVGKEIKAMHYAGVAAIVFYSSSRL
jgi:NO-binding membrane sensor protein with MHYT domain